MKLLLVFALLAFVCMARSAPAPSPPRQLILPSYDAEQDAPHEESNVTQEGQEDDEDSYEEKTTTTTTTTTTRRTPPVFPTRNRHLIPSRRPNPMQTTTVTSSTTRRTAVIIDENDQYESVNEYDGDFKYVRNFRKYFQRLMEDIKKLLQGVTGLDFGAQTYTRQPYLEHEE